MRTNVAQRWRLVSLALSFFFAVAAWAQGVRDPRASVLDVAARRAFLRSTKDPVILAAVKGLPSCVALPAVAAPEGEIVIPPHYLSGSHGPTNPAEAAATRVYQAFAVRITGGMNRWVATGDEAEARCALDQLDAWARAKAMLNYSRERSSQAWYQIEWTGSSAGITASALAQDKTLDSAEMREVAAWLADVARKDISFEKPTDTGNNHHYWRGLTAIAAGVVANDDKLFQFGVATYKDGIRDLASDGSLPKEMARHERALHYQIFALEPLILTAQFASRQGVNLYGFAENGRNLQSAVDFFGRALKDPELVRKYASEDQTMDFGPGSFTSIVWYASRFGMDGLPPALQAGIHGSCSETNLGGNATVLAAK